MNKNIIIVSTHKKCRLPEDDLYVPMMTGAALDRDLCGYMPDNFTADNISDKNEEYCELTALYEIWKGIKAEYAGLVQYRRFFAEPDFTGLENITLKSEKERYNRILTGKSFSEMIPEFLVFVPKKRNYVIETLYSHYAHTHDGAHLDVAGEVIGDIFPKYLKSFNRVMEFRSGYMFNMMVMRKDLLNSYCEWLFKILFRTEELLKKRGIVRDDDLSAFDKRLYGRISEILFNVWLDRKKVRGEIPEQRIKELPFVYAEKIDIKRKAVSFAKAKLFKKKYESSF